MEGADGAQWEKEFKAVDTPTYIFPPDDLIPELVGNYFTYTNILFPLLHRPTFEKAVAEGLHTRDTGFAGVFMLVCCALDYPDVSFTSMRLEVRDLTKETR